MVRLALTGENMKNKFLIGLFLLIPSLLFASEITPNYNLAIPSIASKDWQPEISRDIISMDSFIKMLSADSAFIDAGTTISLRGSDNVALGALTPRTKLDVIGNTVLAGTQSVDSNAFFTGGSVGINMASTATPLTKLEVIGFISSDGLRLDPQTSSPDTTTLKGAILAVSKDADGTFHLNFYDGSSKWYRIKP